MGRLSFDTTFLIDLQRERRKGQPGPACRFLDAHRSDSIEISSVVWGEYLEGFESVDDERIAKLQEALTVLVQTATTSRIYAALARKLRSDGLLIGSNDLWIGAASLEHAIPLVTKNAEHFRRLPGLRLIEY